MSEQSRNGRDLPHTILSVVVIGILMGLCFWILRPFLMALLWAAVIVVATWPVFERLEARFAGRRGRAVAVMGLVILLVILVPITLAVLTIAKHADSIAAHVQALPTLSLPAPPAWVGSVPVVGKSLAKGWSDLAALGPEERAAILATYARRAAEWFAAQAGGIGLTIFNFILTVFVALILYAQGDAAREKILRFARRLAGVQGEAVAVLASKAVRGVVLGVAGTALVQATLGGIGLFVAGVPAAPLLVAVMFLLCLAQLGPLLVLAPAVVWLYASGEPVRGTVLLVVTVVASTLDNVVRPLLIKRGADLPLLIIFVGVIGGLVAFGVVGLFVGPVVLAVSYTLLNSWVGGPDGADRGEGTGAAGG